MSEERATEEVPMETDAKVENGDAKVESGDAQVENAAENEGEDNEKEDKKKKKKKSSRSRRSRSRSKDRDRKSSRKRRSSRSRSKDKGRDRSRRDRSKSPRRDRDSRRERTPEKTPEEIMAEQEAERARKEMEAEREANRDQYTVFVSQIHPKIGEKDLYEFFTIVGRVEDIRLIRDQRTQKSKGLCYVEFWERESVHKATALSGQLLGGYPITIQVCETDLQNKPAPDSVKGPPTKLYVGQLHFNVTDEDLRPVFEAFGPLQSIELHKDPVSGQSKGFGFVTYQHQTDASAAKDALDGLEIAGKAIKVNVVEDQSGQQQGSLAMDDGDGDSGMAMTALSRAQLMQKLQRGNEMGLPAALQPPKAPVVVSTPCILIRNMFDPKTETEPDWDLDIKEDVEEECSKFGALKHIFVDKNSLGNVYLRFYNSTAAEGIVKVFHGRWFASRQIQAGYMEVATYDRKFPSSATAHS